MKVKVECGCETKFAFEVEPVNGRMPVRVNCPSCGADGTEAANAIIREQLAASSPPALANTTTPAPAGAKPRIRIGGSTPAPAPAPPPPPRLASDSAPVAAMGESAAAPVEAPAVQLCPKHRQEAATDTCYVCGKPICPKCMAQFGYLCSVYCQSQAEQRRIPVPFYEGQKFVVQAKEWKKTKLALAGVAAGVLLLFAAYGWYVFVGCKPRTLYSLQTSKADRPVHSQLLSTDEMLVLRANKLALLNVNGGKEIWSTTLPAAKPPASPAPAPTKGGALALFEDDDFEAPPPRVRVNGDDIWVSLADRVVRFERKTGKQKSEVPIKERIREVEFTDASILVIAEGPARQRSITHIALPSGTPRTEVLATPSPPRFAAGRLAPRPVGQPRMSGGGDDLGDDDLMAFAPGGKEFLPAGENVVQFKATLIERRMVAVQAMKAAPAESALSSDRLSARDSLKATTELLNEMQRERTGGVTYENESRYQVTLRRLAPGGSPDWTGEVIGPPRLFPQKTVDLLVAGKSVHAFSKKNQKLWEGKMSYPVADRMLLSARDDDAPSPCLEEGGSLYLCDKGTLTAFDVRTGNVRWRVPSVGISQIVRDSSGMLYVSTTSASPESIQYSQQVKLTNKDYPVLMKVDASSGKVLWKADKLGEHCFVSGKYVYVTQAQISGLDVMRAGGDDSDVPIHHRIYRVDPGTGKYIWEYYQAQAPKRMDVQKNRLLLQYANEVRVLSYLTL